VDLTGIRPRHRESEFPFFSIITGEIVVQRNNYIEKHAIEVKNLDV
jgi:hypothetical protein